MTRLLPPWRFNTKPTRTCAPASKPIKSTKYTVGDELEPAVDAALALTGTENLLDVGTGPGDFPGRLRAQGHRGRLVGLDQSEGMVAKGRARYPGVEFLAGNAQALPFANACFDVVCARHMLYHVDDVAGALAEAGRVLRPGGKFLAVTNASDNLAALRQMSDAAVRAVTGHEAPASPVGSFNEKNGALAVRNAFGHARVTFVESALVFPGPAPVLAYFDSERTMRGFDPTTWQQAHNALARLLDDCFAATTPWRVSKRIVLITAEVPQ